MADKWNALVGEMLPKILQTMGPEGRKDIKICTFCITVSKAVPDGFNRGSLNCSHSFTIIPEYDEAAMQEVLQTVQPDKEGPSITMVGTSGQEVMVQRLEGDERV